MVPCTSTSRHPMTTHCCACPACLETPPVPASAHDASYHSRSADNGPDEQTASEQLSWQATVGRRSAIIGGENVIVLAVPVSS